MRSNRGFILLDHGSRRAEANAVVEAVAGEIQNRRPDLSVAWAHLEICPPDLRSVVANMAEDGKREIIVHPFMLAPGKHAARDIPGLVATLESEYPQISFRVTAPIGAHPDLATIVLDRAKV
ncbi:MAG: CbiX/SirB N-terminal domain-containing protein [Leptospiraceae bacterium]|nr:CbiX/SirB N-terminal domain-containing protein [Leptospiraceae bacterium]